VQFYLLTCETNRITWTEKNGELSPECVLSCHIIETSPVMIKAQTLLLRFVVDLLYNLLYNLYNKFTTSQCNGVWDKVLLSCVLSGVFVTWRVDETMYNLCTIFPFIFVFCGPDVSRPTAGPKLCNILPAGLSQTVIGCEQFKRWLNSFFVWTLKSRNRRFRVKYKEHFTDSQCC